MPIWSSEAFISALALSLLHSLWQGTILGLIGGALSKRLHNAGPDIRYGTYSLLLFTIFAIWIGTFTSLYAGAARPDFPVADGQAAIATVAMPIALTHLGVVSLLRPLYPVLVCCWALGVCLLSMHHLGGSLLLHRLFRMANAPCPPDWTARGQKLAAQMGISRKILLRCSSQIDVPCAFGVLRSCILLPLGAMAGLTPAQAEALIAHELAHLACHDVLVNAIQVGIETILFYHPAVRWLSFQIRVAREQRCDDLAIAAIGGDRAVYARALFSLEEARAPVPQLALGARGSGSRAADLYLAGRIRRVLGMSVPERRDPWTRAVVALGATTVVLATFHSSHADTPFPRKHMTSHKLPAGPAPQRNRTTEITKPEIAVMTATVTDDKMEIIPHTETLDGTLRIKSQSDSLANLHLGPWQRVVYVPVHNNSHRGNHESQAKVSKPVKVSLNRNGKKSISPSHAMTVASIIKLSNRHARLAKANPPQYPAISVHSNNFAVNLNDNVPRSSINVQSNMGYIRIADASAATLSVDEKNFQFRIQYPPDAAGTTPEGQSGQVGEAPMSQQRFSMPLRAIRPQDMSEAPAWIVSAAQRQTNDQLLTISRSVKALLDAKGNRSEVETLTMAPQTIVLVNGRMGQFSNLPPANQVVFRHKIYVGKMDAASNVDKSISKTITDIVHNMKTTEDINVQVIERLNTQTPDALYQDPAN